MIRRVEAAVQSRNESRREFLKTTPGTTSTERPAILGGEPVYNGKWPARWPQYNKNLARKYLHDVMYSHRWTRPSGELVVRFEQAIKKAFGVKYAVSMNSGTSAMDCALNGCQIGPGDEVLVPAYTFISGVSLPLVNYALPVLVDVDQETFQMDPDLIEEKITEHTRAIMLCHYSGSSADMDRIMAIADKHSLYVIEDACMTGVAEWRGQKLGTFGHANAIGHQKSKILPTGEGGTVLGNDREVMERAYSWHDYGRKIESWDTHRFIPGFWPGIGLNYKMTEFQAAVGLANLEIWEDQMAEREKGGRYLDQVLPTIPGICVQKHYEGCTRASYYYCLFRYDKSHFHDLPVETFVRALAAEGIPATRDIWRSKGEEPFIEEAIHSRTIRRLYPKERLDWYRSTLHCPVAQRLCQEEAVRIYGHNLITDQQTLEAIPEAIRKIQLASKELI